MRNLAIEKYKTGLKLSRKQREIVVGTLLGDGHLETQNQGHTYRLKLEHCLKQSFYIDWLYEQFRVWVLTPPRQKRDRDEVAFQTVSHPAFRFYATQFYDQGCKIVPKFISKWLTPLALAIWFMDDGSLKSSQHRALILNTQGFGTKDLEILRQAMKETHNLKIQLRYQKDGIQLLITEPDASHFAKLIKPYLLPEFRYKLGKLD